MQKAVHAAVRIYMDTRPEAELTIPSIATQAGVTRSTIYRRWGSLTELLADVAVERLRPDGEPEDTCSFLPGDLEAWLEQFVDEVSSRAGQAIMRDFLASPSGPQMACRCSGYIVDQLGILVDRAGQRGEPAPTVDRLIDLVVAPVMYRLHFVSEAMTAAYRADLLQQVLDAPPLISIACSDTGPTPTPNDIGRRLGPKDRNVARVRPRTSSDAQRFFISFRRCLGCGQPTVSFHGCHTVPRGMRLASRLRVDR